MTFAISGTDLPSVSSTFHGRDVFAPVAAHLGRGVPVDQMGSRVLGFSRLSFEPITKTGKKLVGEVIHIDRFGNAITNIREKSLRRRGARRLRIALPNRKLPSLGLERFYEAVPSGRPLALVGSAGFLEIAVNGGNAAKQLKVKVGDPIMVAFDAG